MGFRTAKQKQHKVSKNYQRLRDREQVKAMHIMGYSPAEIAKETKLPESTVRRYIGGK